MEIYSNGEQAHVPLLVGWNSEEGNYRSLVGQDNLTKEIYEKTIQKLYNNDATAALKVYNGSTDDELEQAATDLASDRFIGYSTWKWSDIQSKTGGRPVYRYLYSRPRPSMRTEMGNAVAGLAGGVIKTNDSAANKTPAARGAVHSAEIEYAMGNLPTNRVYDWQPEDYKVSEIIQAYFANFIKTGNPNGLGLSEWPATGNEVSAQVMNINVSTKATLEKHHDRYSFLDKL